MKDYKRLTEGYYPCLACENGECLEPQHNCEEREECEVWCRLFNLENKIKSGELCDREEIKNETAKNILTGLYELTPRHHGNKYLLSSRDVIDIAERYGVELFGKTEQVGNSDTLEDEE